MFRDSLNWAAFQKALAVVLEPERGERKLISSTDDDASEYVTDTQAPGTALWFGEGGYWPLHSGWDGMLLTPERGSAGSLPFGDYSLENA